MAGEDQRLVPGRLDQPGMQVGGGGVGEVVTVPLGPADEVVRVPDVQRQPGPGVRAVEGHRDGGLRLADQPPLPVPGVVEAGAVPAVLREEVVRLPGDVRQHQQQFGRMRLCVEVPHGEGDMTAVQVVRGGEHRDVRAGAPVLRDVQPPGLPPVVAGDRPPDHQRRGLGESGDPGAGRHVPGAVAAVVADPVDVHGEFARRVHRDPEVHRAARADHPGGGETLDLLVHVVGVARGADRPLGPGRGQRLLPGRVQTDVPGHRPLCPGHVVVRAPQPGQRALAEGVGHAVCQRAGLPAAVEFRPHAPLPQFTPANGMCQADVRAVPAHHKTLALRHPTVATSIVESRSAVTWSDQPLTVGRAVPAGLPPPPARPAAERPCPAPPPAPPPRRDPCAARRRSAAPGRRASPDPAPPPPRRPPRSRP